MRSMTLILLFAACSNTAPASEPVKKSDAPDWVTRGSGAFAQSGARAFYGVGVASNIRNVALLQTTADNRARAEITKIFETYSASLMKDYMASVSDGDKVSEEQNVSMIISTFSAQTLSGVQIVDRYKDKETGAMYSLATLDLYAFKDAMGKMKEISQAAREYVLKNAERVHGDLEKEAQKHESITP